MIYIVGAMDKESQNNSSNGAPLSEKATKGQDDVMVAKPKWADRSDRKDAPQTSGGGRAISSNFQSHHPNNGDEEAPAPVVVQPGAVRMMGDRPQREDDLSMEERSSVSEDQSDPIFHCGGRRSQGIGD